MMTILKIAWRNILRNRRRSLITLSAIGFGLGALIFIWAFVEGAHQQMIENYTSLVTGHLQVHQKGFHQQPQLEKHIDRPGEIMEVIRQYAKVKAVSSRIKANALVSSAESSAGVLLLGVDPQHEKGVSSLPRRLRDGKFFQPVRDEDDAEEAFEKAADAQDEQNQGIILGFKLAKNLNVELDEKVVVMSQAIDGSIASAAFVVQGLLDTGTDEIDQGLAMITHQAAQELFVMPDKTSEIVVRLQSPDEADFMTERLKNEFYQSDFEVLSWQEVSPSFQQWIEFDNAFIWLIVIVVMVVVAIGILNTVLMGVLERTREFGILLAIGTQPFEIIAMVAWEAIFLGLIGSFLGIFLGTMVTFYFSHVGIDLTFFASALNSFYIDSVIYPQIQGSSLLVSTFLVALTSLLVSVYPAWHASRLNPVSAIRSF